MSIFDQKSAFVFYIKFQKKIISENKTKILYNVNKINTIANFARKQKLKHNKQLQTVVF